MARLEIALDGNIKGLQKALRAASYEISNFGANIKGTNLTTVFQKTERSVTKAVREIKTEFSDSNKEIEEYMRRSGAEAKNWSHQFVRAANAVAPPVRRAKVVFDGLHSSLRHIPKSTSGFGILTNQTQALTRNLQRISLTANAATQSLVGVGRQGASAIRGGTSAAISFGHIIQDLPYGINGVANNITQLTTQMGYMAASAKAAGVSMRTALIASISNPATLAVLGVSALTSAMVFFTGRVGKAKKGTDDLKSSILSLSDAMQKGSADAAGDLTALDALYRASQDVGRSIRERTEAVDALQDKYPKYFGNLSNEAILAGEAADAYGALRANIIQAAQARAIQDQIVERTKADLALQPKRLAALEKAAAAQQKLNAFTAAYSGTSEAAKQADQGYQTQLALLTSNLKQAQREFQNLTTKSEKFRQENQDLANQLNNFSIDAITGGTGGDDKIRKAREAIKDISTDALKITTPLNEGLNKAAKDFERGLVGAIAKAAGALTATDFAEVYTTALRGPSGIQVQPILTPKDTPTGPGVKIANEWGKAMERATDRFSRDFYRALEDIAAQGKLTFGGVFSGIVQSFTRSFQNIFVQHFSEKLKASFSDLSRSFSTKMQGAISAIGIAGGLLQSTGTAAGQIAGGALSGVASGALVGASIGAVGGPLGAAIGGVVGLIGGIFGSNKRREEIQKQQLEQLKKAVAYTSQVIGKFVAGVGVVENVSLNTYGELTARVKGKDLEFVLSQQQAATARGL